MGAHGECIGAEDLAVCVNDVGFRHFAAFLGFDDDFFAETGLLIGVDAIGDVFGEVDVLYLTTCFTDDDGVEGVPFADHIAFLDTCAVIEEEFRAVGDVCVGEHHLCGGVDDAHFCESADNHIDLASAGVDLFGLHCAEFVDFKDAFVARGERVDSGDVRGDTTDVECTEGELCTGLAD